jgi:hypothetical protein
MKKRVEQQQAFLVLPDVLIMTVQNFMIPNYIKNWTGKKT